MLFSTVSRSSVHKSCATLDLYCRDLVAITNALFKPDFCINDGTEKDK